MALDPVRRTVYYRRAQFSQDVTHTLQQLVANALHSQKRIRERLETLDAQGQNLRVISAHETSSGFICGRLTAYERGAYQAVIDDDPNATTLPLYALEPPKQGEKQQQFVPGILYFAIHKNHVAIIQSAALRASGLEHHQGHAKPGADFGRMRSRLPLAFGKQADAPTSFILFSCAVSKAAPIARTGPGLH